MASRALIYLRTRMANLMQIRKTGSISPGDSQSRSRLLQWEFMPVYVSLGLISCSLLIGVHTLKNELAYAPDIRVSKKRRKTVPEVEDPDYVVDVADKYINKSIFRKVAHIQDFDSIRSGIEDPIRPDPFTRPRTVVTLKSAGVDPSSNRLLNNA